MWVVRLYKGSPHGSAVLILHMFECCRLSREETECSRFIKDVAGVKLTNVYLIMLGVRFCGSLDAS